MANVGRAITAGGVFGGDEGSPGRSGIQWLNWFTQQPLFGALAAFGQSISQGRKRDKFIEEEEAVMAERIGATETALDAQLQGLTELSAGLLRASEAHFAGAGGRFSAIADPLSGEIRENTRLGIAGAEQIVRGQETRERSILRESEGLGEVERADLNRRFGAFGRTEQGRLAGLGLGGTLLSSGVASGVERLRGNELGLLDERLRRDQIDLRERLSAETLQARAGALEFSTGLRGEGIAARGDLSFAGLDFREQAFASRQAEQERLGLAPGIAGVEREQAINRLYTEQFLRTPPYIDQNISLLANRSATQG